MKYLFKQTKKKKKKKHENQVKQENKLKEAGKSFKVRLNSARKR